LEFRAQNPKDLRVSEGIATYELAVTFTRSGPKIREENGRVVSRRP
jgi:hypothetical protein